MLQPIVASSLQPAAAADSAADASADAAADSAADASADAAAVNDVSSSQPAAAAAASSRLNQNATSVADCVDLTGALSPSHV